jgi:hypothetical protein
LKIGRRETEKPEETGKPTSTVYKIHTDHTVARDGITIHFVPIKEEAERVVCCMGTEVRLVSI